MNLGAKMADTTLAESFMRAGSAAVWASSGLTEADQQVLLNREFLRAFLQDGYTLGEAVRIAKSAVTDPDIRSTWILFGDPLMRAR